jgi:hypothetical protein
MTKKNASLGLIGGGLLILVAAVGYLSYTQTVNNPGPAPLPDQISEMMLISAKFGLQAVDEIARLHNQTFPFASGAVGMYGSNHQVKLWVSGSWLNLMATRMVTAMGESIVESNSPFTPTGESQNGRRTIYSLEGLEQQHYYFQSGRYVIWLAADPELAEQALQEVLGFYP